MKKSVTILIITMIILTACLWVLSSNPIISCKATVSEHELDAIKSQAAGLYSNTLPLVPVCVCVDAVSEKTVFYTIYYFPFGTVGMSYTEAEGYNIEKPLTGA